MTLEQDRQSPRMRAIELLDRHDISTEQGRIELHNAAYHAGMGHEMEVLWASEDRAKENPGLHEIIEPAFEAGKIQFPER